VLAEISVTDPEVYEDYKALSTGSAQRYGGRFVVRGGPVAPLEGEWPSARYVLLEFPDRASAQRWYDSPEYAEARAVRQRSSVGRLLLLEGAS